MKRLEKGKISWESSWVPHDREENSLNPIILLSNKQTTILESSGRYWNNLSNNLWLICVLFLPINHIPKIVHVAPIIQENIIWGKINPLRWHCWVKTFPNLFFSDETTLQGTNISRRKALLKMNFLFARWDMLVPWRVPWCETCFLLFCSKCFHQFVYQTLWVWCNINQERDFLRY